MTSAVRIDSATINARFHREPFGASWSADGALPDAGVLIHFLDQWEPRGGDGKSQAWRAWKREDEGAASGFHIEMSSLLIYAGQQPSCCPELPIPVYIKRKDTDLAGVVFRPGATTKILCGSASDRSGKRCNEGIGWCPSVPLEGDSFDPHADRMGGDGCGGTWRPEDFGVYLKRSCQWQREVQAIWGKRHDYNEILLDGAHWTEHLPDAVEAFVGTGRMEEAREQHWDFLRLYGLTKEQVPLLRLDTSDWRDPFFGV